MAGKDGGHKAQAGSADHAAATTSAKKDTAVHNPTPQAKTTEKRDAHK